MRSSSVGLVAVWATAGAEGVTGVAAFTGWTGVLAENAGEVEENAGDDENAGKDETAGDADGEGLDA